ncbi:S1 family peptidase [Solimonas sp. K1W22B-7]|uniref:S1 family peptidase n=1 Tax=Solimonas sp. K1W22B-7 TaxID=2303331 RepID=UPI0013C45B97|nr:serine protease [Solimonas sp. K1W22B-7]
MGVALVFGGFASAQDEDIPPLKPYQAALDNYKNREKLGRKIFQGIPATFSDRPWQVGLMVHAISDPMYAHYCGGVLIDSTTVLTSAHCVSEGQTAGDIDILAATDDLTAAGQRIGVSVICIHEDYVPSTHANDIAKLVLGGAITSPAVPIKQLASKADIKKGSNVTVSGWGNIYDWGLKSEKLLKIVIPIQSQKLCNAKDAYGGRVLGDMFCAGKAEGGMDACNGDSGGPATLGDGANAHLAGLVSWARIKSCGLAKVYGVYTNVPVLSGWIDTPIVSDSKGQQPNPKGCK